MGVPAKKNDPDKVFQKLDFQTISGFVLIWFTKIQNTVSYIQHW